MTVGVVSAMKGVFSGAGLPPGAMMERLSAMIWNTDDCGLARKPMPLILPATSALIVHSALRPLIELVCEAMDAVLPSTVVDSVVMLVERAAVALVQEVCSEIGRAHV